MKKLITTILVVLAALPFLSAQETPDFGCTPSHEKAFATVKFFLTISDYEPERIVTGTTGIPVAQIKHVDNYNVCIKLDSILNSIPKLKKIKEDVSSTMFYYQTDMFYFIFWKRLNILGDVKRKFIVVNKEYKVVGEFYI